MDENISTKKTESTGLNWPLLVFLVGASYAKIYITFLVLGLYILYSLFKKYQFPKLNGVNKFYFIIIIAGAVSSIVQNSFSNDVYFFTFGFGAFTWIIAGLVSYLLYVAVVNISYLSLHKTLKGFFALNALASFIQLGAMMLKSGSLVPYWYWDASEYFGSSTGDHVYGIFGNVSITNATISIVGAIYFLYTKELKWALLCLFISLLCTSNATLLLSLSVFALMLFFAKEAKVRKYTFLALLLVAVVYPLLTIENVGYIGTVYEQGTEEVDDGDYNLPSKETVKTEDPVTKSLMTLQNYSQKNYYKYKLNSYASFINDLKYLNNSGKLLAAPDQVNLMDPQLLKNQLEEWYGFSTDVAPVNTFHKPLKLYSHIQTLMYLKERLANFLVGAGIGNFSSKTALKATGLNLHGGYADKYTYVSEPFSQYHLYTTLYVFSLPISEHSVINFPNSIYNQVAGEYGLLGVLLFIVFYLGLFYRQWDKLTVGKFILPLVLLFFEFEYWFEMISLTVLFEFIMFIDIYKAKPNV